MSKFINIDFPFKDSPQGFLLNLNSDTQRAVKADLMHLLLTRKGQRLYNPNFGTDLIKFIFEPNDTLTRNQVQSAFNSVLNDLVAKRGLYDYLVVCDGTNNTPDRIDRNELWVDIAIQPVKAIEFIYIPVRLVNTGAALTVK